MIAWLFGWIAGGRPSRRSDGDGLMRVRKMGRLPRGELKHNAHDRIRATDPHQSHRHEHLGDDLKPKREAPHNGGTRLRHVGVSGTGQSMSRVVGAQKQKRLDRGVAKII
jgi:hypothetical protein